MSRYGYHILIMSMLFAFVLGSLAGILLVRSGHDPTSGLCSFKAGVMSCRL